MYLKPTQELLRGLLKACVYPRPIAWVSSYNPAGQHNLAPFSYFNVVADEPPMIMFSTTGQHKDGGPKDTLRNIQATGEFTVNMVSYLQREAMNMSSVDYPHGVDEFERANVLFDEGEQVKSRRVLDSPVSLECLVHDTIQLPKPPGSSLINTMVLGRVIGFYVRPELITEDNQLDMNKMDLIARCGYQFFSKSRETFVLPRPTSMVPSN